MLYPSASAEALCVQAAQAEVRVVEVRVDGADAHLRVFRRDVPIALAFRLADLHPRHPGNAVS